MRLEIRHVVCTMIFMDEFLDILANYYAQNGRHDLPWRQGKYLTPYHIVVSEVMLQQTQVARVIGYFEKWMQLFPDVMTLAKATNEDILRAWQGLGYNNRGLRLGQLARVVVSQYNGTFPQDRAALESLPSIGPYTAGAVRAFVWNEPEIFVETNIRRVMIHHFFNEREEVSDKEVLEKMKEIVDNLMQRLLPNPPLANPIGTRGKPKDLGLAFAPREFYWAMMDYGATLPKILKSNPNTQSKHYTRQSRFEGSVRQVRSGIVKWLLQHDTIAVSEIANMVGIIDPQDDRIAKAVQGLEKDGMIQVIENVVRLKK